MDSLFVLVNNRIIYRLYHSILCDKVSPQKSEGIVLGSLLRKVGNGYIDENVGSIVLKEVYSSVLGETISEIGGQGAITGGITGGVLGGYRGYKAAKDAGMNPWTGKSNVSLHAAERMAERGVSLDAMQDALDNPIKIGEIKYDAMGRPSQVLIGKNATVVINPSTGKTITTYPTSTQRLNAILNK